MNNVIDNNFQNSHWILPAELVSARTLPCTSASGLDALVESVRLKNSSVPPKTRFATGVLPDNSCPTSCPSYSRLLSAGFKVRRPNESFGSPSLPGGSVGYGHSTCRRPSHRFECFHSGRSQSSFRSNSSVRLQRRRLPNSQPAGTLWRPDSHRPAATPCSVIAV